MIGLNLLPAKEKVSLKKERLYQFIIISLLIFFLGTILVSLELFFTKKLLEENLPSYGLILNKNQQLAEKIRKINFELIAIEKIQSDYSKISPILVSLAQASFPNSIRVKSFVLNKGTKQFEIKGWAENRTELLKFQGNLEKLEFISKIESPLSNILKQENIEFEFKGELRF